jgi:hypothetical protein
MRFERWTMARAPDSPERLSHDDLIGLCAI